MVEKKQNIAGSFRWKTDVRFGRHIFTGGGRRQAGFPRSMRGGQTPNQRGQIAVLRNQGGHFRGDKLDFQKSGGSNPLLTPLLEGAEDTLSAGPARRYRRWAAAT